MLLLIESNVICVLHLIDCMFAAAAGEATDRLYASIQGSTSDYKQERVADDIHAKKHDSKINDFLLGRWVSMSAFD